MSSPITLSGFNNIDFNQILTAVMEQERQPVVLLEGQQSALQAQKTAFGTLASKLSNLESALDDLTSTSGFGATTATVSDTSRLAVSAGSSTPAGSYEIYVDALARSQVTTSATTYDALDTVVASGGSLTVGSKTVSLSENTTLEGLAAAINDTDGMAVSASIVRNEAGKYQLVLTGQDTGVANAFTVTNNLTGGAGVTLGPNVQAAQDARVRINGVTATSATNTFDSAISGLSFTALQAQPTNPITITITASNDSLKSMVDKLVSAFNDLDSFITQQAQAAGRGESTNIGRDALVRGLRRAVVGALNGSYGSGTTTSLAQVGFSFERTGQLSFNATTFSSAVSDNKVAVQQLFRGTDGTGGVFGALAATIKQYTAAGGLVPNAQDRIDTQVQQVTNRISAAEERLAIRRAALQKEYTAADLTISQLNSQASQLTNLGGQYRLF